MPLQTSRSTTAALRTMLILRGGDCSAGSTREQSGHGYGRPLASFGLFWTSLDVLEHFLAAIEHLEWLSHAPGTVWDDF